MEWRDVSNVDNDASNVVKRAEGSDVRSLVGQRLIHDKRDSRFDPRAGYLVELGTDLAGLGGSVKFFKPEAKAAYFFSIEDWTVSIRGEGGRIWPINDSTSIQDRFFIGGSSPRGFKFGGLGPRDNFGNDSLGAEKFYVGTAELSFPLPLPEDLQIRGRLFTDIASAWDTDTNEATDIDLEDSSNPRVTVGTGVSWNSPFGPLIVDLGFAVKKESFDETEILSFNFGTQF